jgi:hypothetical protein
MQLRGNSPARHRTELFNGCIRLGECVCIGSGATARDEGAPHALGTARECMQSGFVIRLDARHVRGAQAARSFASRQDGAIGH